MLSKTISLAHRDGNNPSRIDENLIHLRLSKLPDPLLLARRAVLCCAVLVSCSAVIFTGYSVLIPCVVVP